MKFRDDGGRVFDDSAASAWPQGECIFEYGMSDHPNAAAIVRRLLEAWQLAELIALALERREESAAARKHYNRELAALVRRVRALVESV